MAANVLRPSEGEALEAWAGLVAADAEQVARVREPEPPADHYGSVAPRFRPGAMAALEWPVLDALVEPGETVLDIGAGGGRFAVPLAQKGCRVIALEPSEAMRGVLTAAAAESSVDIRVADSRWPAPGWSEEVDVSLAAHVCYDIAAIGPFLDAMERWTRRLCVAMFGQYGRGANLAPLFEAVHGEPLQTLPALKEFVALLGARNRRYEVRTVGRPEAFELMERDEAFELARRMLWLAPGSAKDARMRELIEAWWGTPEGIRMPAFRRFIGVVSWEPPRG
ncbi:class I SAM-dependent methyltransferase [Tepidiforma sp.]|uniref:class I SAM-dependent methyltransferase n=1 Tax=Tepidiforma sp. TaxID=2682230 RepID=UPI002ADE6D63|nr:methyltransferase domain-containing protein [Tepidiforma sp.]